mmetsp:Transcript_45218/g.117036  ORF Transcript_45218/g.117036 Transcript_45218/m.117036 type:complete len:113 (-) Transcript_45218:1130-1468(-)
MAARVLAQLILMGGQIIGRAAFQAYNQALANAAKKGATGASAGAAALGRMTISEARKILNVNTGASKTTVEEAFERLHTANDPAKGGSSYIQAKIRGAKTRLMASDAQTTKE